MRSPHAQHAQHAKCKAPHPTPPASPSSASVSVTRSQLRRPPSLLCDSSRFCRAGRRLTAARHEAAAVAGRQARHGGGGGGGRQGGRRRGGRPPPGCKLLWQGEQLPHSGTGHACKHTNTALATTTHTHTRHHILLQAASQVVHRQVQQREAVQGGQGLGGEGAGQVLHSLQCSGTRSGSEGQGRRLQCRGTTSCSPAQFTPPRAVCHSPSHHHASWSTQTTHPPTHPDTHTHTHTHTKLTSLTSARCSSRPCGSHRFCPVLHRSQEASPPSPASSAPPPEAAGAAGGRPARRVAQESGRRQQGPSRICGEVEIEIEVEVCVCVCTCVCVGGWMVFVLVVQLLLLARWLNRARCRHAAGTQRSFVCAISRLLQRGAVAGGQAALAGVLLDEQLVGGLLRGAQHCREEKKGEQGRPQSCWEAGSTGRQGRQAGRQAGECCAERRTGRRSAAAATLPPPTCRRVLSSRHFGPRYEHHVLAAAVAADQALPAGRVDHPAAAGARRGKGRGRGGSSGCWDGYVCACQAGAIFIKILSTAAG